MTDLHSPADGVYCWSGQILLLRPVKGHNPVELDAIWFFLLLLMVVRLAGEFSFFSSFSISSIFVLCGFAPSSLCRLHSDFLKRARSDKPKDRRISPVSIPFVVGVSVVKEWAKILWYFFETCLELVVMGIVAVQGFLSLTVYSLYHALFAKVFCRSCTEWKSLRLRTVNTFS